MALGEQESSGQASKLRGGGAHAILFPEEGGFAQGGGVAGAERR